MNRIFLVMCFAILSLLGGCSPSTQIQQATPELYTQLPDRVPVLMYHYIGAIPADQTDNAVRQDLTVSAENFEAQLKWLKENAYTPIPISWVLPYIEAKGKLPILSSFALPEKPIVLSFDDGYEDAYTIAFPLLKKYEMVGAFGIITGSVGNLGYLTWDQIKEMRRDGMEFASHTVSHPDLRVISAGALQKELTGSKKVLQNQIGGLGETVEVFVYPAGKYNAAVIDAVKAAGYKLARTTNSGSVTKDSSPFELPTVRIHGSTGIKSFAAILK